MPHGGAGRSYKNPTVGLKNRVQMPHSGTTPKLYFPVNNLQKPHLWISNNLIKTCEAQIFLFILLHETFLQFDWLRAVVFQLNLKQLHLKITNLLRVVL